MTTRFRDYIYVLLTIALTVYGQLVLKWRVGQRGSFPSSTKQKIAFLMGLVFDPAVLSGFAAAFLASLAWMAAMTKFELSHAYPFMSLNFVMVLLLSAWLFHEPMTPNKLAGVALIIVGTVVVGRGS
jgi:multidrug transporter EmrE-like cation transporter